MNSGMSLLKALIPVLISAVTATAAVVPPPSGTFAITHVRLFDGEAVLADRTVFVKDGKISSVTGDAAVPADLPRIEGLGMTLLPGLIDAHVHAYPENALRQAEALGVTTVLDMFSEPTMIRQLKAREESAEGLSGADIYSAGILATVPGGHGTEYGFTIPTLTKPGQAQAWVDARIAEGSDYIKIVLEDGTVIGHSIPTLDRPTFDALVAAAHQRHKLAVCHIGSYAEAREAVEDGADGLMHLFLDREPAPDFGKLVAKRGVFVVPTLSVLLSITGTNQESDDLAMDLNMTDYLGPTQIANLRKSFRVPHPPRYEVAEVTVRQLKAAGAKILAGTDAPNPGTEFGVSLHGEMELLVKAGLTPLEALRAATSLPADCFNLPDRGRVSPGRRADLLLVRGDPTTNIKDTRNIVAVWKSGSSDNRVVFASKLAAEKRAIAQARPLDVGNGVFSTFEDGTDHASFGAGWSKSTDALFGGKSTVDYAVVSNGAGGTGKSLQVTGEIVGGVPYPWAGAMLSPGERPFAPTNLSGTLGLQFWAKGDGKTYRVMCFTPAGGSVPSVVTFVAGPEWKLYQFPFGKFDSSDGHDIQAILISGGPEPGKFSFQIDEVSLIPRK